MKEPKFSNLQAASVNKIS